jgi:glycosyltransferase involved in cell wall biosynthesis
METSPQVSVVIPVHETAPEFFREAIESVRAQRDVRWELVIVLDAAPEQGAQVARDVATHAPDRVKIIGSAGGVPMGLSAARNLGIANSQAPAVAFLDADDVLEPDALVRRLAVLDAHPDAAMVYGSSLYWHSWTGHPADRGRDFVPELGVEPGMAHAATTLVPHFLDGTAAVPCPCSILVRRWALEASGGFDEAFRDLYEDQVFYTRIALRFPVVAEDWVLDRYRQHRDSMSARANSGSQRDARLRFLNWLERESDAAGVSRDSLARTIERERWKLRHPRLARLMRFVRRAPGRLAAIARVDATRLRHDESRTLDDSRIAP